MSWDLTQRQVRSLEQRVDGLLNRYSRLAGDLTQQSAASSSAARPQAATARWPGQERAVEEGNGLHGGDDDEQGRRLEADVERNLAELSSAVSTLTRILEDPTIPSSASQQYTLQRHREVLLDFERDYRRSRSSVQQARDRRDLLGSVKVDIENYKARHGNDTEALLAERSRLDNSHRMLDGTLDQAYATRADLSQQRSTLMDMTSRMTNTASQIPGLNNVIRLIHRRRQRDRIIMGCVIGTLTVLLLMYITR